MAIQRKVMAKKNVKRTQRAWSTSSKRGGRGMMSAKPRSRAMGSKLGLTASRHYQIIVRPSASLTKLKSMIAGTKGHDIRLGGKKITGPLSSLKWTISKSDAVVRNSYLQGRSQKVKQILTQLGTVPRREKGDVFIVKLGSNILSSKKLLGNKIKMLKKSLGIKKLSAEKMGVKKLAVKKLALRKAAARKLAARKLTSRKPAARKLVARKSATRKLAARKLTSRKPAARKLAARKLASRKLASRKMVTSRKLSARKPAIKRTLRSSHARRLTRR